MAKVRVIDNTDAFVADMESAAAIGAGRAAGKLRTFARRKVNRKFHKKKKKVVTGNTGASRPGESPKRRTGRGRLSIEKTRNLGTRKHPRFRTYSSKSKAPYMSQYEFGPISQRRPWLEPAVSENESELAEILITPAKRKMKKQ